MAWRKEGESADGPRPARRPQRGSSSPAGSGLKPPLTAGEGSSSSTSFLRCSSAPGTKLPPSDSLGNGMKGRARKPIHAHSMTHNAQGAMSSGGCHIWCSSQKYQLGMWQVQGSQSPLGIGGLSRPVWRPNLHASGRIFNFYGNNELKLQVYLQAKCVSYIAVPRLIPMRCRLTKDQPWLRRTYMRMTQVNRWKEQCD